MRTLDPTDRDTVAGCLHEVRQRLIDGQHNDAASRAAEALEQPERDHQAALLFARALPADDPGPETEPEGEGPFLSRHPLVSVVQAEVDAEQHRNFIARAWLGIKRFSRGSERSSCRSRPISPRGSSNALPKERIASTASRPNMRSRIERG